MCRSVVKGIGGKCRKLSNIRLYVAIVTSLQCKTIKVSRRNCCFKKIGSAPARWLSLMGSRSTLRLSCTCGFNYRDLRLSRLSCRKYELYVVIALAMTHLASLAVLFISGETISFYSRWYRTFPLSTFVVPCFSLFFLRLALSTSFRNTSCSLT